MSFCPLTKPPQHLSNQQEDQVQRRFLSHNTSFISYIQLLSPPLDFTSAGRSAAWVVFTLGRELLSALPTYVLLFFPKSSERSSGRLEDIQLLAGLDVTPWDFLTPYLNNLITVLCANPTTIHPSSN